MNMTPKRRFTQIGIDRILRLKWLEKTAFLVLAGNEYQTIKGILQEELQGSFRGAQKGIRGSLDKTITILLKIWAKPSPDLKTLHNNGLKLVSRLPEKDRIAVHWGMIMATYPFWGRVADQVGRLIRLQGKFRLKEVQRRLREQYGERQTVSRATQRLLRSFVDWGILKDATKKGTYVSGLSFQVADPELQAWLIESFLNASPNGSLPLQRIFSSPGFFPFQFAEFSVNELVSVNERLILFRQGLNEDMIMLDKV